MASVLKLLRRGALGLGGLVALLLAGGWTYESLAEHTDQARYKPPGRLVDIGGRRMHLNCAGAGAPTVVLEPGAGEFSLNVEALQRRVAAFTRVCSYDRAGYGWSDPAPSGRSIDARADDLERMLRAGNVEGPYVLVGASYGGLLVRSFARQQPTAVAGMVLVDAAEEQVVYDHLALLRQASGTQRMAAALAEVGLTRPLFGQMVAADKAAGRTPPEATAADLDEAIALTARRSFWRTALDEGDAYDTTPAAERVAGGFGGLGDRPLVVIRHGKPFSGLNVGLAALDAVWASGQARLARLSRNSRTIVASQNGHDIAMENPALVADAVRAVVDAARTGRPLG